MEMSGFKDVQVSRRMADLVKDGKVHAEGTGIYKGRKHQRWFPGADLEQMRTKPHCKTCQCGQPTEVQLMAAAMEADGQRRLL